MGDIKGNIYLAIFNIADIIENRIGISEKSWIRDLKFNSFIAIHPLLEIKKWKNKIK